MDYVIELYIEIIRLEHLRALNLNCKEIIWSLSQTYQTDFNATNFYVSIYQCKQ